MVFFEAHCRATGDVADRSHPIRRLGNAVGITQDVGLPLVEMDRAVLDEPVVVGVIDDPLVGDSLSQSRVGPGPGSQPLVGHMRGCRVAVRVNEDAGDAKLPQPLSPDDGLLAPVTAG
jgi:hypothetical protein